MSGYKPGARTPDKYGGRVGPNYQKWGEQEHRGLVYNPATDTYYEDPKAAARWEAQAQRELQDEFGEKPPKPPGIWEQAAASTLPTAATLGGMYGIQEMLKPAAVIAKPTFASILPSGNIVMTDGSIVSGTTGAKITADAANSAAATTTMPSAGGGVSAPSASGNGLLSAAGGSGFMSAAEQAGAVENLFNIPVAAPVQGGELIGPGMDGAGVLGAASPYLGAAGAGLGLLGVANAMKGNDREKSALSGGLSGAGLGAGLGMAAPLVGLGPVGWGTLGLLALAGGVGGGALGGIFGRKKTADYQAERWGKVDNAEAYAMNHPEGDDGVWDSGKYAGQKWSWDKALDLAKDDPTHFAGVLGNYQVYGSDWGSIPADKRDEIVRRNIEAGNYSSDKGDIIINDPAKAQQIKLDVMGQDDEENRGEGPAPLDQPIV